MDASLTYSSRREGVPPCLRTSPPLGRTLGVQRTSWRIPFPRHACMFLVLGFRGAWFRTLRLESQSSAGLRMQYYPRAPDLIWPGHLHGTGCLSARAMDTGFPTVVWRLCLGLGFAVTSPILAGVCGVCGYASVLACTPPLLARVLWRCGYVWVRVSAALCHSWPGVGVCVCLCARFPCTPPLLAGVCGVAVCAWARVSVAPRQPWLGRWGLCVFWCTLRLYPATPDRVLGCVCLCAHSACTCRFWLGCVGCVCVLGPGFCLRPATPGLGVGVCVCLCACSACTPPLLVGVCGVGGCAWARVSAAPHHSWLGCWGVCVFVCALCLYPAIPGSGARRGCLCSGWFSAGRRHF